MKKLLTLALALVVLAAFTGLGAAQEKKAEEKKPAPAAKEEKKAEKKEEKKAAKPKVHQITGEVTKVDDKAKTVTIKSKDKEVTLNASKLKALPKAGDKVVAKYTEADGKMTAKSIKAAKKEEKKAEKKEEKKAEPKKEEKKAEPKKEEKK